MSNKSFLAVMVIRRIDVLEYRDEDEDEYDRGSKGMWLCSNVKDTLEVCVSTRISSRNDPGASSDR